MKRKFVRSWDVFDTLITRKCGPYDAIFEIMATDLGADFRTVRIKAETTARESKYDITLDDIYDVIQVDKNWTTEERKYAQELEIKTEFENVIPITENISLVQNGDVLVSDMYLSHDIILGLLHKAGLDKAITLYVSTRGKQDGSIWKKVRSEYVITKHLGDNPNTDFLRPLLRLIPAALTNSSLETPWEGLLRANGAPLLSRYIREARLRSHRMPNNLRVLHAAQIEVNFPLLLLASASLVLWCRDNGKSKALMSSRDCCLWFSLAKKIGSHFDDSLAIEYFLISRVAALKPTEEYLTYARRCITPDSVIVDLSMTGTSLAGLADRLGLAQVSAYVISLQRSAAEALYGNKVESKAKVNFEYLFAELALNDLEALNQALTPSIHDVVETADGLCVKYANENRSSRILDAIKFQNAVFTDLVDRIPDSVLDEVLSLARSTRLTFLARECERHARNFKTTVTRLSPGSALWNDPNAIKLNLPYASSNPIKVWLTVVVKRLFKPFFRQGSILHPYRVIPGLIIRKFIKYRWK